MVGEAGAFPSAGLAPRRLRLGWYWLLPLLTFLIVAVVLVLAWSRGGVTITLHFAEGHGLKPGDPIRCRGIVIGEVRSVRLDTDSGGVTVQAELHGEMREVARAGSRFWIARPQADLTTGVRGLDTVVGAKYIIMLPGGGEPQTDFVGLEEPPILETVEPGGLEVVLKAHRLAGLRPGAPVTFRQVRVGSVLRVALASDASAVHAHAYIRPAYARLVRDNSVFWNTSGVRFQAGLRSGVAFSVESAESVLTGGVALATRYPPGKEVASGHPFDLKSEEPKEWEKWRPALPLTDARLPEQAVPPRPVPAALLYRTPGRLYGTHSNTRRGLVVPVGRDLLGPSDLLTAPAQSKGELSLATEPPATHNVEPGEPGPAAPRPTIRWLVSALEKAGGPAPGLRVPTVPEECLLVGEPRQEYRPVSVARFKEVDGRWEVDAELFRDTDPLKWHGAAAVAVADGRLLGLLLAPDRRQGPYVLPLDKKTARPPP
jgi:hypothetical protein